MPKLTIAAARQTAIAAIEEYERTAGNGLRDSDRKLLERFRSKKYALQVGTAWLAMEKHRRHDDDYRLLIIGILGAWHFALEAPAVLDSYAPAAKDFVRLRHCAEELSAFFAGPRLGLFSRKTKRQVRQLSRYLAWAIMMFNQLEREISTLPQRLRLSRELYSPTGLRVTFTNNMSVSMLAAFGRPLDGAVAAITEIVLGSATTVEEVRGARRRHGANPSRQRPAH